VRERARLAAARWHLPQLAEQVEDQRATVGREIERELRALAHAQRHGRRTRAVRVRFARLARAREHEHSCGRDEEASRAQGRHCAASAGSATSIVARAASCRIETFGTRRRIETEAPGSASRVAGRRCPEQLRTELAIYTPVQAGGYSEHFQQSV